MSRRPTLRKVFPALIWLLAAAAPAQEADGEAPRTPRHGEDLVARTFYLQTAEVRDVMTILRSMTDLKHVAVDEALDIIDVRGTAESVELAERLVRAHDRPRSEVVVDVELIEFDRKKLHESGRELAGAESGGWFPVRLSASELRRLKAEADARLMAHPRLSALSGKKAELMVGDRVPITTDGQGSVSYQEVGFRLVVTPRVHPGAGEVTLELNVEMSRRDSASVASATPVIATERIASSVRLGDGETYFLAGMSHGKAGSEASEVGLALTPRITRRLDVR